MSLPFDTSIAFLFLIIGAMVVLFLTEILPLDLTAFLGLAVLVVAGYVKPEEAFQGFASPAVITMLSVFFVSAGLQQTGVASIMGRHLHRLVGSREVPLMAAVMLVAALLSAFMFNVAAAAVLLPAVVSLAREASLAPARLLIPLAFGAILGGTITLVGTPPNLLASQVLTEHGLKPFGLLDFAPFGLALLGAGILYMITVGRRLLPKGTAGMAETERADLASVYHIEDRLFSLRLPESSPLVGKSLEEARLGSVLGVQVVSIVREGEEILAPGPSERIQEGDQLLVEGRRLDLEERLELQDVHLSELGTGSLHLGSSCSEVCGIILRLVKGSPFIGKSLREHGLGKTPRVTVAAIWRDGDPIRDELADLRLKAQDELLVIGDPQATSELATRTDLDVVLEGSHAMRRLEGGLFSLPVPDGSVLVGKTLEDAHLRKRLGLTVIGVLRGEAMELFGPGDHVRAGDRLLVTGRPSQVAALVDLGHVEVGEARPHPGLESEEIGLVEAVVAPRSAAVGKTLRELSFRKRYGLRALAIWRGNRPVRFGLPDLRLQLGDGLLLHGRRDRVPLLRADPDFVVLTTDQSAVTRSSRAPFALAALLLMIVLVMTGVFPIQVAAFLAAVLVVLSGALTMRQAYTAVEWRVIFLVAALLPLGIAMERTGAARLLADTVAGAADTVGPTAVVLAFMALSSLLSQGLDGAPTVVLLGPIAVSTATKLGLSPHSLMMAVGLSASAAFMTPFSQKANLLVMGAGGYRAMDYLRVGTPLTLLVLAIIAVLVPLVMPS